MASGDPDRTDPPGGPELAHPEAAGWVLGILDEQESDWFAGHLPTCPDCRAAVAEFGPAARLLATAAPAALPPPVLQARTLAGVARAATAARRDQRPARWRGWSTRMLALAAAVVVAAGVSIGLLVSRSAPAGSYAFSLHPGPGLAASGHGVMQQADGGWSIKLTVAHLPDLGSGRFYQCWWTGPGDRPGHPVRVSAGTFTVGPSGAATLQMWTAANPDDFPTMKITVGSPAGTGLGQVVLAGAVTEDD